MQKEVLKLDAFNNLSVDELQNLDGGFGLINGFFEGFGNEAGKDSYNAAKAVANDLLNAGKFITGFAVGFVEGLFT